jgi:hypothetical protein
MAPTLFIYFLLGIAVAVAVFLAEGERRALVRLVTTVLAIPFWPFFVPMLLTAKRIAEETASPRQRPRGNDDMMAAINQVDAELERALTSLDGWAGDALAKQKDCIHELRQAWTAQSERIKEMDRLLDVFEEDLAIVPRWRESRLGAAVKSILDEWLGLTSNRDKIGPAKLDGERTSSDVPGTTAERLRLSQQARRQNIERLRQVRRRAQEDLIATLAWVRELVSMIHLAKFMGAPPSRAEELVAQIAAAVEGLSAFTWQEDSTAAAGSSA